MTCGHCEMSIREEVAEVPGVDSIEVSHQTGKLVVSGNGPVEESAIIEAVEDAGYKAVRSV